MTDTRFPVTDRARSGRQYALLSLALFFSGSLVAAEIRGQVIHVSDGDTLDVLQDRQPVRVRLANIDAPEKTQPFGRWSGNQLKALVAGQAVTVVWTQKDRYGRVLGRVYTANGTDAGRRMVQSGAAWVYDRYNTDPALPALQREAQAQKRGLWADAAPVPPWTWRHKKHPGSPDTGGTGE